MPINRRHPPGRQLTVPRASNRFNAGLTASYQQSFFGGEYLNLRARARATARIALCRCGDRHLDLRIGGGPVFHRAALPRAHRHQQGKRRRRAAHLAITQAKVSSGVSSNLDLAEQQAVVAQQESRLPGLIAAERQARYALAILFGRTPENYDIQAQNLDGVVAPVVQPGLPSELLLRNPSVAQRRSLALCRPCQCGRGARGLLPVPQPDRHRRLWAGGGAVQPVQSLDLCVERRRQRAADHLRRRPHRRPEGPGQRRASRS